MANNGLPQLEVFDEDDLGEMRSNYQKYLVWGGAVFGLLLVAYVSALWFYPSFGSAVSVAGGSEKGAVSSKKAIAQLPDQRISHPVYEFAQGVTVDENSDQMRAMAELNYREAMSEDLSRIEAAVAVRRGLRRGVVREVGGTSTWKKSF